MTEHIGSRTLDGRAHRWSVALMCGLVAMVLVGAGTLIRQDRADARQEMAERFQTRAELTASFTRDFVDDLAARELAQAERLLATDVVAPQTFEQVVQSFGFEAAVLLDGDGRLLQVFPHRPDLLGIDMTVEYPHLRAAVDGQVGVSSVVPSAALRVPVVAVAVPYDTPSGRRVFGGGFTPARTPLASYVESVVPVVGGSAVLLDDADRDITARTEAGQAVDPEIAAHPVGVTDSDLDGGVTVAIAEVPGLPWRVALMAPSDGLYAPVASSWGDWVIWGAMAAGGGLVARLAVRLGRARRDATEAANTDALTGLPNRRAMQDALRRTADGTLRRGETLAALMVDIDHFKAINDTYGHDVGDEVIRATADLLADSVRGGDIAGRWGGEEFLVLLPHADVAAAQVVAERVRRAIEGMLPPSPAVSALQVTASVGVAASADGDLHELLLAADAALYAAKAGGRNRVEVSDRALSVV
jgi:diguanylate cyclase (GGDEF)-like protein